jgi:anti-sigma B factor antagonist
VRPSNFRTEVERGAQGVCIALFGELDVSTVVDLRSELRTAEAEGPSLIVLDMRGLEFMDSMGLGVLLGAVRRARVLDRRLVVVPGPKQVESLLRITGVDKMLDMAATPAEAGLG